MKGSYVIILAGYFPITGFTYFRRKCNGSASLKQAFRSPSPSSFLSSLSSV